MVTAQDLRAQQPAGRYDPSTYVAASGDAPVSHAPSRCTVDVAGWWDQEDFYGPVTIYREPGAARA